jgi:hypothetical protein
LPPKSNFRDLQFWGIIFIFLLAVHINTAIYLGRIKIIFQFYSIDFPHLLGIIGASFIAIFTPIFYILKRRKPKQYKLLINLHMFGNATSFLLSSMHVVFRLLRLPLGIGFILFVFISLLALSGFISKFNLLKPFRNIVEALPHTNRAFHISLTFSFYLLFSFHLLNVLG